MNNTGSSWEKIRVVGFVFSERLSSCGGFATGVACLTFEKRVED
jgi:hypothetical protein